MASPSVETFLASLKRCLAAPGFLESFYERFVGSSEEVREKFRNTDMKRQARVLEESLYVVANAVQGEENSLARGALSPLAARHGRQGLDIPPASTTCGSSASSGRRGRTTRNSPPPSRRRGARPWPSARTTCASTTDHHHRPRG